MAFWNKKSSVSLSSSRRRQIMAEVQRETDNLTRRDISGWRSAWQQAINVDNPRRIRLYEIYRDALVDNHLSGCIEQRKGMVLSRSFCMLRADGQDDDAGCRTAEHCLQHEWFKQLMEHVLDARYWGHSLIELGDTVYDGDGCLSYSGVTLIDRRHVIPEYGVVVRNTGDDISKGIRYRERPWNARLIEAGSSHDLGLLLKAAPHTISKKNALAYWDTFAEVFGMPMRIARTNVRDEREKSRLERMMETMGTAFWGVFSEGTDIEIKESTKGDAYNVYDRRIDRANSELSKLIIGQTMTIEDGSSLSQSQTHLAVFENLVNSDAAHLSDVVNNQLLPKMASSGFPVEGYVFKWAESQDYSPEQQVSFETMLLQHYEVDGSYFVKKYGVPVGARLSGMNMPGELSHGDGGFFV